MMRLTFVIAASVGLVALALLTVPAERAPLDRTAASGVRGVMHVHTRRSDGSGTAEDIAAAAARAGLQFVFLTDHGNGTRTPARSVYLSGVLMVDGIEVSGDDGHVVALGLPKSPYPLGGEVRDIVEDVARMGGMSLAAHPASPKDDLRWTDWDVPVDGLEWLNGDSEARNESWVGFGRAILTYPFRASGSLASVLDRPDDLLRRWDRLTARRRVVAVAGTDAHARLGASVESAARSAYLPLPGYESMFRAFSITVSDVRLTGDAEADAGALVAAIRGGRVYSAVDAVASPAAVSLRAVRGEEVFVAGDLMRPGGQIELLVETNAPAGSRIVLLKDGERDAMEEGQSLRRVVPGTEAVYRVEVHAPDAPGDPPVPWVVTNPIYVREADEPHVARTEPTSSVVRHDGGGTREWRVETSARSKGAIDPVAAVNGSELLLRWGIGGLAGESPFAAFVLPAGPEIVSYDRLMFTARADRPMRLSVQFRTGSGDRWRRSVPVGTESRTVVVFFDDTRPAGATGQAGMPLTEVRDLLFVFDTVNASPGTSGQVWIDDVAYAR